MYTYLAVVAEQLGKMLVLPIPTAVNNYTNI